MISLYFKVARSQLKSTSLYLALFMLIFIVFALTSTDTNQIANYEETKSDIAVMNHSNEPFAQDFVAYLSDQAEVHTFASEEAIKDALFYGQITAAVFIPETFEEQVRQDSSTALTMIQRPNTPDGAVLKQKIDQYLGNVVIFTKYDTTLSLHDAALKASTLMQEQVDVTLLKGDQQQDDDLLRNSFFKYEAYIITAVIIFIVGMTMKSMYRSEIMRRNLISPMKSTRMNLMLFIANIMLTSIIWCILSGCIIIFSANNMFSVSGVLYLLNSYVYCIVCTAIGYMLAAFVFNKRSGSSVMDAFVNIYALGSAFLCGVFVPQELIAGNILQVAQFLPCYWYIKSCDLLAAQVTVQQDEVMEGLLYMGILLLYGAVFALSGIYIMKQKRSQDTLLSNNDVKS